MKKHLAIFTGRAGEDILLGKKRIESRFSRIKNLPFGKVSTGDLVYIKPSGKDIIGQFRVKKVIFFDSPDLDDLSNLRKRYGQDPAANCKYATLIFVGDCERFITSPVKLKKKDLRGWVVLDL